MKKNCIRKISLDIETTGLNKTGPVYLGHKIIEIGAVEIINREITKNHFHFFLNPGRLIDHEAFKIHGIKNDDLLNKPKFSDIYLNFLSYIGNSDIIVHNSKFDISFLNYEIKNLNLNYKKISDYCHVIDTLTMARKIFPGKKNNLDALCKRYKINHSDRKLHSAFLDATLLAKLYLRMTTVQKIMNFEFCHLKNISLIKDIDKFNKDLVVLKTSKLEYNTHLEYLNNMMEKSGCLWMN
ncbi:DNA polymerase III subunit epsilon [Buchnera aphidicola]|uniref:DNA polymerase III subunit epsilon n=1 Tax=Buchnera aphidicola TaxID=9 RepID=UPI0031B7F7BA